MKTFKKIATVKKNNKTGRLSIVKTTPNVTLDVGTELYVKVENEVIDVVQKLLEGDSHQFSTRPCQTCRTISDLISRPFGCSAKALLRKININEKPKVPPPPCNECEPIDRLNQI